MLRFMPILYCLILINLINFLYGEDTTSVSLTKEEDQPEIGIASWYGNKFHGRTTANGETYNMYEHTAAHKTLPFNTIIKVVTLKTGLSTLVRINDRGPFIDGRIIDLSLSAARDLNLVKEGIAEVRLEIIESGHSFNLFRLQVGAFKNQNNADKLLKELLLAGFKAEIEVFHSVNRIVISSIKENQLQLIQENLMKSGFPSGLVRKESPIPILIN
tara:strand:- start:664 stop:1311 length:648 start_codon:yes stop_codon:yes gene_type:complete